jgi:riboflavin kinase/FMN adenylyltransferase
MDRLMKVRGKVIKGQGVGQKIGFPTINIEVDKEFDLDFGVYACKVYTFRGVFRGAMHYGPRRILEIEKPALEVHLFDFEGDLYGQEVKVEIYQRIRPTQNFSHLEDLKRQIALDVEAIKKYFN